MRFFSLSNSLGYKREALRAIMSYLLYYGETETVFFQTVSGLGCTLGLGTASGSGRS